MNFENSVNIEELMYEKKNLTLDQFLEKNCLSYHLL